MFKKLLKSIKVGLVAALITPVIIIITAICFSPTFLVSHYFNGSQFSDIVWFLVFVLNTGFYIGFLFSLLDGD